MLKGTGHRKAASALSHNGNGIGNMELCEFYHIILNLSNRKENRYEKERNF
jgi:hypothetical protein